MLRGMNDIVDIFCETFSFGEDARDVNRHVNNVAYVQRLQEVAIAHTERNGWPMQKLLDRGVSWVVHSHAITYLKPCQPGEEIRLYTWVEDFRRIRSRRRYRFVRAADGAILAEAESDWVFLDTATGRPKPIPQDILDSYVLHPGADPR